MSTCDWVSTKMGDCFVAFIDEAKFWQEVITEFMEWDEESQERWAQNQLKKFTRESDLTLEQSLERRQKSKEKKHK